MGGCCRSPDAVGVAVDGAVGGASPAFGGLRREAAKGDVFAKIGPGSFALDPRCTDAEGGVFTGIKIGVVRDNLKALEDGVGVGSAGEAETGEYADREGSVSYKDLVGIPAGNVGAGDPAFSYGEGELVDIFLYDFAFDLKAVVAAIAGVDQVKVNCVACVGYRDLHVPVGHLAGIVPADVLEDLQVFRVVSVKAQGGDAVGYYSS